METDFVSEVDRKFFQNNMLSNEDWEASMDLTDLMGIDSNNDDFFTNFQNEFQLPDTEPDIEADYFKAKATHDDLLNDWSDSSDSGISGLQTVNSPDSLIKSEPLSPTLSHHSDSCDSAISQLTDFPSYISSQTTSPEPTHDAAQQEVTIIKSVPASTIDLTNTTIKTELPAQTIVTSVIPSKSSNVQIDSILNSKIKIKPKPEGSIDPPSPKKPRTIVQDPVSQKSLVLTAEEFQRLTSQGVLRFQPPKQESIQPSAQIIPVVGNHSNNCTPTIIPISATNGLNYEDKDTKAFKRQQRMIKNRESASLSRKRKKEYMSSLECKLQEYCDENERLKQENLSLKRKLTELHTENESLKKTYTVSPSALKKTVILAAFFLMFTLNLGSWSTILISPTSVDKPVVAVPLSYKGRQLMSVSEENWAVDTDTVKEVHDILLQYQDSGRSGEKLNITDMPNICPTYFNRTESLRLAEQLAGWMYRHEEKKKKVVKKGQKEKQLRPISTLRRAMRGDLQHDVNRNSQRHVDAQYELQLFEGANTGRDFLKALHRRNDTFYVLSFDEDYYLVPALYHNKTSRPRMSLVMPAVALNESMMPSEDQVGMMQIDCEVMNTQLIHVQKSAIPRYAREKHNTTYTKYRKEDRFYKDGR